MGITLAMLRLSVDDIRVLLENDLRVLKQFNGVFRVNSAKNVT